MALERLGTEPSETLFIDDTPGHIEVAEALGIRGYVHDSTTLTAATIQKFLRS